MTFGYSRLISFANSFRADCRGAVYIWTAFGIIAMIGFGGLAIDMSYAYSTRNMLQVTASSAALAAAPELPDQGQAIAKALEYVEENMPSANHGAVLVNSDVVFGNWDSLTETWTPGAAPVNALEVTTRRSTDNGNRLDLFLSPILGLGFLDMEASAVAYAKAATAWDVVIVQDVTGTFTEEIGDARLGIDLSDSFVAVDDAIADSRGVCQQVSNGNRPFGRLRRPG